MEQANNNLLSQEPASLLTVWQKRLNDLINNIEQDLQLLKEYEDILRYEADPRHQAKYRREIECLSASILHYWNEYNELQAKAPGKVFTDAEDIAPNLQQLKSRITELSAEVVTTSLQINTLFPGEKSLLSPTIQAQVISTDILLVTTTEVEAIAVLDVFQTNLGCKFERRFIDDKTYYELGVVNGAKIFMVQSEMGSVGPNASLLTVQEGIRALSPSAVIMVGIAFGLDPKRQSIGEILVARQLLTYEQQRISSDPCSHMVITLRGDRPPTSTRLLDRFRSGHKDWQGSKVQFGLILSGEKLIDHQDYRDQLRKLELAAIGGEMEGAGLYAAAQRYKVDWILIKAICDWADGKKHYNKSQRQQKAARNAASFVAHVIQLGGFVS